MSLSRILTRLDILDKFHLATLDMDKIAETNTKRRVRILERSSRCTTQTGPMSMIVNVCVS